MALVHDIEGERRRTLADVILRNMAEGVVLIRIADHRIVYANPRFEQLFGYGPGELVGLPVEQLNYDEPGHSAAEEAARIVTLLAAGGEATVEVRNRRRDGSLLWCRARVAELDHAELGRVWVSVHQDITAEKQARDALAAEQGRLQAILDALPVGLWIADADGRIVSGNAAGERIWGGARYVGLDERDAFRAWRPDTGEAVAPDERPLARAIRDGRTTIGERLRIQCSDGSRKTILNSATPLYDDGALVGALVVTEDITRLSELETSFSALVASAPDAIIGCDEAHRIRVFNPGAEAIFRRRAADAEGEPVATLFPPESVARLETLLARGRASGLSRVGAELTALRHGGEPFPAELSLSWTPLGCTMMVRDISARRRAEDERSRLTELVDDERAWLRSLLDSAPTAVLVVDKDERVTPNRRAVELLDVAPGLQRAAYLDRLRRPDGTPLPHAEVPSTRALAGEAVYGQEMVILARNGESRHILGSSVPVTARDGTTLGVVVTFEDVTVLKRREEQLAFLARAGEILASSLDYQQTLDRVSHLIVPALADLCVTSTVEDGAIVPTAWHGADPARAEALDALIAEYGLSHARGTGLAVREARVDVVPDFTPELRRQLARDARHDELFARIGVVSYLSVPLVARGSVVGAMSMLSTDPRRRYSEADLAVAEPLARLAAIAIDNARLYRAEQRATRARDEVLGIVAHDLRNPLSSIKMLAMLIGRHVHGDAAERADRILRSVGRMNRLIQDLLDVAKIESGHFAVEKEPVDARQLAVEAVDSARPLAERVELGAETADEPLVIDADRDRVLQLLGNLVGNALKFTPPGGHIRVVARRHGGEVELAVRDDGVGIPADQLPHVFDRFYQGNARDRRGAGLGLAICQGIAEAHGGRIWAESTPGRGTTIRFVLPAHR